ncbi:hypothetical protein MGALJ_08500 [Mycobacterium gallinarum]|uniref:Uncharacterized protein n=1 Tax=Mycobacterium gallinarum TaxID=39689 RepID=A0A9W4FDN6_9MYCO|nr:hypothetical protein MGALJ_08500 [Mycobacterium gallinarum]
MAPADDTGDGPRRGAGLRFWVVRAPDFDLLERLPERAAVLLGMPVRLVAIAPQSPSATRVTERYQSLTWINIAYHLLRHPHVGRPGLSTG